MKNKSIEQLILASRPQRTPGNAAFVERTMRAVRRAGTDQAFETALYNANKSKRVSLLTRFKHLPKYTMVAVAAVGILLVSGTTYAAIRWLEPIINITGSTIESQENKRLYTMDVKNCGIEVGGETVDNGHQVFEVANDVKLSDMQIKKVISDSCTYQQMLDMMNTRWPNDPRWPVNPAAGQVFTSIEPGTGGNNVLNDPWIGKITGLSDGHIQITSTLYEEYTGPSVIYPGQNMPDPATLYKYYPKGKQVVHNLDMASSVEVVDNGHDSSVGQLKVGDTVLFMSEVQRTVESSGHWSDPQSVKVTRLIKAGIDAANVMNMGVGNPAIVGGVTRLEGCQNNGQYLCVAPKEEGLNHDLIYSYTSNTETPTPDRRFTGNEKYLRTDINMNNKDAGRYFHTIEGRVTKLDGNKLLLLSRGKVIIFTVELPYDAASSFNQTQKLHIATGDMLTVNYIQQPQQVHTEVHPQDVMNVSLLERRMPDGSLVKY